MLPAARSLTEPPGLCHSALPRSTTPGRSRVPASRRSSGVLPMRSNKLRPRLEAACSGSYLGAPSNTGATLWELCVITEPRRHDHRNVNQGRKHGMKYGDLDDKHGTTMRSM